MRKDWLGDAHLNKKAKNQLWPPVVSFLKGADIIEARKIQAPSQPFTRTIGLQQELPVNEL
jgi:hypothetical protein